MSAALAGDGMTSPEPDGRAILAAKCGRCHAFDATSASPLAEAPPFREVFKKFPTEELRIRLAEGVVSHYKDMPQVDFTDEEVAAIIGYLSTLYVSP
jgi:mono/diheme cytochrome c family protein